MKKILVSALLCSMVLLAACGPSDEEARKAGFVTGKEMVTATKLGLKNHEEYAAYIEKNEAEKLGFDSVLEMRKLQGQGYQSKALYLEAVAARKGGFTSIEDYRLALWHKVEVMPHHQANL